MKWTDEQINAAIDFSIGIKKLMIFHCEDQKDADRIEKYVKANYPDFDFEIIVNKELKNDELTFEEMDELTDKLVEKYYINEIYVEEL